MDVKIFDKKRLPSQPVTRGPEQAPHRSDDDSMGLSEDQINSQFVGGIAGWGEAAPRKRADGAMREIRTAAETGGSRLRMKSSQVLSQVIADSIAVSRRGRCCAATAEIAGCDKSLTGVMMAGVRLNVPSIFIYRSSILAGGGKGCGGTVAGVFEADGQNSVGDALDGDMISSNGRLDLNGRDRVSAGRRAEGRPRRTDYCSGALCKQAQQVGSARLAAVTRRGAKSEVIVYADQ